MMTVDYGAHLNSNTIHHWEQYVVCIYVDD